MAGMVYAHASLLEHHNWPNPCGPGGWHIPRGRLPTVKTVDVIQNPNRFRLKKKLKKINRSNPARISWDFMWFPVKIPGVDLDSQHEEQDARPGAASGVMALMEPQWPNINCWDNKSLPGVASSISFGWSIWWKNDSVAAETHCITGAKLPSFVRHLGQKSISNKLHTFRWEVQHV